MAEEEEPLFSSLDIFLFSLIIGLVIYWFMSRKKPEPIPEFKKLDTPPERERGGDEEEGIFSPRVFQCVFV
ncbi:hypothetical protein INR49_018663 [Caranx melampygus]|nr:hypothetical protein INR49_018663 [Caranx melampygus]